MEEKILNAPLPEFPPEDLLASTVRAARLIVIFFLKEKATKAFGAKDWSPNADWREVLDSNLSDLPAR